MSTVSVKVTDSTGASVTKTLSYTVNQIVPPLTPPASGTLLGVSMSRYNHQLSQWDVARCYNRGDVDEAVTKYNVKAVLYTFDSDLSVSAVTTELKSVLKAYPGLLIRYSPGNEVDRHYSGTAIASFLNKVRTLSPAVRAIDGCEMWLNITGNSTRNGNCDAFKLGPDVLDGLAPNCYPQGRNQSPPVWTPYDQFVDPAMKVAQAWGVKKFGCWETGIPVNPSDPNKRPAYVAGLVQYMVSTAPKYKLAVSDITYWDSWLGTASAPDNRFQNDGTKTATAFKNALS